MSYKIIRFYQNEKHPKQVIARGLTLEEAKAHCDDPETCSKTCGEAEGVARTQEYGSWFDGWSCE